MTATFHYISSTSFPNSDRSHFIDLLLSLIIYMNKKKLINRATSPLKEMTIKNLMQLKI